jgi:RNA-directed DNA polymerase
MINVDKDIFVSRIVSGYKMYTKESGIPSISSDMISEFKLDKKFVYRINENTSELEGITKVHERLLSNFLNKIPLNNAAKAYIPERSYLDFLEPHRNSYYFVRIDLKNFFHSISRKLLIDTFRPYFSEDHVDELKKQKLLSAFINIVSYKIPKTSVNKTFSNKFILPMGFKTSPVISNIVFRKIDILIEDYCSQHNIAYTRYADDMLFSTKNNREKFDNPFAGIFNTNIKEKVEYIHSETFLNELSILVNIGGFKLNKKKTIKATNTISLNGYTIEGSNYSDIQGTIRISNKKTNIIGKLLHELNQNRSAEIIMNKLFGVKVSDKKFLFMPATPEFIDSYCIDQIHNKLTGYRSYLISILKYNAKYNCIDEKPILKYDKLVSEIEKRLLSL